jgi:hypothetical protein
MKGFVVKSLDHPWAGRPGDDGDVFPFLVPFQDIDRHFIQLLVDAVVLLDSPQF